MASSGAPIKLVTRRATVLVLRHLRAVRTVSPTAVRHLETNQGRAVGAPSLLDGPSAVTIAPALPTRAVDGVVAGPSGPSASRPPRATTTVPLPEGRGRPPSIGGAAVLVPAHAPRVRELGAGRIASIRLSGSIASTVGAAARTSRPPNGEATNDADEVLDVRVANGLEGDAPSLFGVGHGHGGQC